MAGPIRQPINIPNLERYIETNAPEIKMPLEVKQVSAIWSCDTSCACNVDVDDGG